MTNHGQAAITADTILKHLMDPEYHNNPDVQAEGPLDSTVNMDTLTRRGFKYLALGIIRYNDGRKISTMSFQGKAVMVRVEQMFEDYEVHVTIWDEDCLYDCGYEPNKLIFDFTSDDLVAIINEEVHNG